MEDFLQLLQQNIHIAPWAIFGLLLLAGFNAPVSEDGMLFIAALLATQHRELLVPLFIAVYLGAYFSDLICFALGWFLGPKLWKIKIFSKMASFEKIEKISTFYEKHGVLTLILGRFIPFGVRNALFLTAGLGKMHPLRFALSDLLACTISCSFFFWLYYTFGRSVISSVKQANIILFVVVAIALIGIWFYRRKKNSSATH